NAFILNEHQEIEPIVQIIDDYHRNNNMAAVFEVRVGKGKLLACALDLETDLEKRPEVPQFEESVLTYMQSSNFQPKQELSPQELAEFLPDPSTIMRVVEGSSRWPLHDYRDMLDGDPNTFWSSEWNGEWRASASHHVIIDLGSTKEVSGCTYTPRQDSENGRIGKFEIHVSKDGKEWGEAVASGSFENSKELQKVDFKAKYNVNYIKINTFSEVNNRKWAAIAELSFF
ncbi:MAG: discoidin domain-containing protein, partial [Bacteroidales bacterium]